MIREGRNGLFILLLMIVGSLFVLGGKPQQTGTPVTASVDGIISCDLSGYIKSGELVVSGACDFPWTEPGLDHSDNVTVSTQGANPLLDRLGVGGSTCLQLAYTWPSSSRSEYRLVFHRWMENTDTSPTSYAVATRTDENTWEIQPDPSGGCGPGGQVGALYDYTSSRRYERLDDYFMPHMITVTLPLP